MVVTILGRTEAGQFLYGPEGISVTHIIAICNPFRSFHDNHDKHAAGVHTHGAKHKLLLKFDDVEEPWHNDGPKLEDIQSIIKLGKSLSPDSHLLTHCWAGMCRSPSAAIIALTAYHGPGSEQQCFDLVKRARDIAEPNRLMLELADKELDRQGKLADVFPRPSWGWRL